MNPRLVLDKVGSRSNLILCSELEQFKQRWCNRWMAAYRIQRWWKKVFNHDQIKQEKEDYIRQVKGNYCHQLELLFFSVDNWEMRDYDYIQVPIYLFEIPKMRELILAISAKEGWEFEIISGEESIYRENFINHYVATHRLINIHCFKKWGPDGPYCPKIVFISRATSQRRRISNEQRLIEFLRKRIPEMEVYTFDDESSATEQAKLFGQCKVLIGLHGAGLANLLWMIGGRIYEITPKGHFYHNYREKAYFRGLTHRYIEVEKYDKSERCELYPRDSILHMSQEEMDKMGELMEIDGIAQKERMDFDIKIVSNNIRITDEIDGATRRKMVQIPF